MGQADYPEQFESESWSPQIPRIPTREAQRAIESRSGIAYAAMVKTVLAQNPELSIDEAEGWTSGVAWAAHGGRLFS